MLGRFSALFTRETTFVSPVHFPAHHIPSEKWCTLFYITFWLSAISVSAFI